MSKEYNDDLKMEKKVFIICQRLIKKLMKVFKRVTGDELTVLNKEIFSRALMWGSLSIFLADKKFTKKRARNISKNFGEKSTVSILSLIRISKKEIIEEKINNAFLDASKLILDDKKRLQRELEKLLKVAEGGESLIKNSLNNLIKTLKI